MCSIVGEPNPMEDAIDIPESEFTADNVETTVQRFFSDPASVSDHGVRCSIFLNKAMTSRAAWTFSLELINTERHGEVQFFGAKCLYNKVHDDWRELSQLEQKQVISAVTRCTAPGLELAGFVLAKLYQVIAAIALQQCVTLTDAPDPVKFAFSFYDAVQDRSQTQEAIIRENIIGILTEMPKEYSTVRLLKGYRSTVSKFLQDAAPSVLSWLKGLLDQDPALDDDLCKADLLYCLCSWLEVRIEHEQLMPIIHSCFVALHSAETFEAANHTLLEMYQLIPLTRHPGTYHRLVEMASGMADLIDTAVHVCDWGCVSLLSGLMLATGEGSVQELVSMLHNGGNLRTQALILLENIMKTIFPPVPYFEVRQGNFRSLDFWIHFASRLVMAQHDRRAGGDRQGQEGEEDIANVLKSMFISLTTCMIHKLQYPHDDQWLHWCQAEQETFLKLRKEVRDVLPNCFEFLQETGLRHLYETLQTLVDMGNNTQWQQLEAVLTAVGCVEGFAVLPDCPYLEEILGLLPCVRYVDPRLLASALSVVAKFSEWLGEHEELLAAMLPLVSEGLQHPQSASKAVRALHNLLSQSLHGIQPHLPHILMSAQEIVRTNAMHQKQRLQLVECVGVGLSRYSSQEARSYLHNMFLPRLASVQQILSEQPLAAMKDPLVYEVKLLTNLVRGLFMRQQTQFNRPSEHRNGFVVPGMEHVEKQNLTRDLLQTFFPTLKDLIIKWKLNTDVIEALCELFLQALGDLKVEMRPLVESVTELMLEVYQPTYHPTIITLLREIILNFKADDSCIDGFRQLLKIICDSTLYDFDKILEFPETLRAFNTSIMMLLRNAEDLMLSSPINMEDLLKCGVKTLRYELACVMQSGYFLTTAFLSISSEDEIMKMCVQRNMDLIVTTVMEVLLSQPMEDVAMQLVEVFQACCRHQLAMLTSSLTQYLDQAHIPLPDQDKTNFVHSLVRNYKDRARCKELMLEFSLKCGNLRQAAMIREPQYEYVSD